MLSRSYLWIGLACGCEFSFMPVAFALLGLFTEIDRTTWVVLNQVKGTLG